MLTESLRGAVKSFIKETNLDTYKCLCQTYDFIESTDPGNRLALQGFAGEMRMIVDEGSRGLHTQGERILDALNNAYDRRGLGESRIMSASNSKRCLALLRHGRTRAGGLFTGLDGPGRSLRPDPGAHTLSDLQVPIIPARGKVRPDLQVYGISRRDAILKIILNLFNMNLEVR